MTGRPSCGPSGYGPRHALQRADAPAALHQGPRATNESTTSSSGTVANDVA